MCTLYSQTRSRNEVAKWLRVSDNRASMFDPLSAIFPSEVAPVMRLATDGERELVRMNWGFLLLQDGRAPRRVVNVRDDKIQSSKFWRGSFEERRCIVPASSYCEPKERSQRLGIGSRSTEITRGHSLRFLASGETTPGQSARTASQSRRTSTRSSRPNRTS